MDFGLLDSEEVRYECQIRRMSLEGNIRKLANDLNKVYTDELEGRKLYKPVHINTVPRELEVLTSKVDDLKRMAEQSEKLNDKELEKRAMAKAVHCRNRIDLLGMRAPNLNTNIASLLKTVNEVIDKFEGRISQKDNNMVEVERLEDRDPLRVVTAGNNESQGAEGLPLPTPLARVPQDFLENQNNRDEFLARSRGGRKRGTYRQDGTNQNFSQRPVYYNRGEYNRIGYESPSYRTRVDPRPRYDDPINNAVNDMSRLKISNNSCSSSDVDRKLRAISNWGLKFNGQPSPIL